MAATKNQDFERIVSDAPNTRTATWYVNTEVVNAETGERKSAFDAGTSISGMMFVARTEKEYFKEGFRAVPDTKFYVSGDHAISENDKLTISSIDYDVVHVEKSVSDAIAPVFSKCYLRRIPSTLEG